MGPQSVFSKNQDSMKGEIARLSTASDLQAWTKNIEKNSLESFVFHLSY